MGVHDRTECDDTNVLNKDYYNYYFPKLIYLFKNKVSVL